MENKIVLILLYTIFLPVLLFIFTCVFVIYCIFGVIIGLTSTLIYAAVNCCIYPIPKFRAKARRNLIEITSIETWREK